MTTPSAVGLAFGRPEAAAVIWEAANARAGASESARQLEIRAARRRGAWRTTLNVALGAVLYVLVSKTIGVIVAAAGGVILLLAWFSPLRGFALVEGLLGLVYRGIGRGTTFVAMSAVLYGMFTPFGLAFRRGRRDRMKRWFDRSAQSYWTPRRVAATDPSSYKRLY